MAQPSALSPSAPHPPANRRQEDPDDSRGYGSLSSSALDHQHLGSTVAGAQGLRDLDDERLTSSRMRDLGDLSSKLRKQRRIQWFSGAAALALLLALLALTSQPSGLNFSIGQRRRTELSDTESTEGVIDAEEVPKQDDYCSVFADEAECEKQRGDGLHRYWTAQQVRNELWKSMKALAELEMRENKNHETHKARAAEQARLFELMRKTISREVNDIHDLQEEMQKKHTAAFEQLAKDLISTAQDLKNYTDSGLGQINGKVTAFSEKQEADSQAILVQIAERVAELNARIEDLHTKAMTSINTTEAYAQGVEAAMKAGDQKLEDALNGVGLALDSLDNREAGHFANLTRDLDEESRKEEQDRVDLITKTNTEFGNLRTDMNAQLLAEKMEMRAKLNAALADIDANLNQLKQNITTRDSVINADVTRMIEAQNADNEAQEAAIAALRADFETMKATSLRRMDTANQRIAQAFSQLAQMQAQLTAEAEADKSMLINRMDTNASFLSVQAANIRNWAMTNADSLNNSIDRTKGSIESEHARLKAQRDADMSMLTTKINQDIDQLNSTIHARLINEYAVLLQRLTADMEAADLRLTQLNSTKNSDHNKLKMEFENFQLSQNANNQAQDNAMKALTADAALQRALNQARAVALNNRLTAEANRLTSIKAALKSVQDQDREDVSQRITAGEQALKDKLDSDLKASKRGLTNKIKSDLATLSGRIQFLQSSSQAENVQITRDLAGQAVRQRKQDVRERLRIDDLNSTQISNHQAVTGELDALLADLTRSQGLLGQELVAEEQARQEDMEAIQSKIHSDTTAKHTALSAEMQRDRTVLLAELSSAFQTLTDARKALESTIDSNFNVFAYNLTRWEGVQADENTEQQEWLQRLTETANTADQAFHIRLTRLQQILDEAIAKETASALSIQNLQHEAAFNINATIHDALSGLHSRVFGDLSQETTDVRELISKGLGDLKARTLQLGLTTNATADALQRTLDAVSDKAHLQDLQAITEMEEMARKAAETKAVFASRMGKLSKMIKKNREALEHWSAKADQNQLDMKERVQSYFQNSLERADASTTRQLSRVDSRLHAKLVQKVNKWSSTLAALKSASEQASAALNQRLQAHIAKESANHEKIKADIAQLLATLRSNQQSADATALLLLNTLKATNSRLNATRDSVSATASSDAQEIKDLIKAGLAELQQNMTNTIKQQREDTKNEIQSHTSNLKDKLTALGREMYEATVYLNNSLAQLIVRERKLGEQHDQTITELKASQQRIRDRLEESLSSLGEAYKLAKGSFSTSFTASNVKNMQSLNALRSKLDQAVASLQAATVDVGQKAKERLRVVKDTLRNAKTEVEQAQVQIERTHHEDVAEIKKKVAAGLIRLENKVGTAIHNAMTGIHHELATQLAHLSAKVAIIKQNGSSTEDVLKAKLSQLVATQAAHDSTQETQISELKTLQDQLTARSNQRARDVSQNVTRLATALNTAINTLNNDRRRNKQDLLQRISTKIQKSRKELVKAIQEFSKDVQDHITQGLSGGNTRLTSLRNMVTQLSRQTDSQLVSLRQQQANENKDVNKDISDIHRRINSLRTDVHRNNTGLRGQLNTMLRTLRNDELQEHRQQNLDVQAFRRTSNIITSELRQNYTTMLRAENKHLLNMTRHQMKAVRGDLKLALNPSRESIKDIRQKLQDARLDLRKEWHDRWRDIRKVNGTTVGWANSMLSLLRSVRHQLRVSKRHQRQGNRLSRRRIKQLEDKLAKLLQTANSLNDVSTSLDELRRLISRVDAKEETDFKNAKNEIKAGDQRVEVIRQGMMGNVNVMKPQMKQERKGRQRATRMATEQIRRLRRRVRTIEKIIRNLRRWRPGTRRSVEPPPPPPSAEPPAPRPAPNAPAPRVAPRFQPPPLAPGQSDPPMPLLFWDHKSSQSGVDTELASATARVRLGAARTGSLSGSIPLSTAGRWNVFVVLQAVEGGDSSDEIQVELNGQQVGSFNNDITTGFPCSPRKCLDSRGLYVVSMDMNGGSVDYKFTFTSSSSDPQKHMWIGVGEAAFLGSDTATDVPPSGPEVQTKFTVISAIDAKRLGLNRRASDGFDRRAYTIPQEPRLVVMSGKKKVYEGELKGGKGKVKLPEGKYTCVVTLPGYNAYYNPDCEWESRGKAFPILSPVLPPGASRVVLQWASRPRDLDSYMLAPHASPDEEACEVSFRKKVCHSGSVHLDKDDVNGHGPETITIVKFNPGKYVFRVDEYQGNPDAPSWDISHAMVTYYAPHLGAVHYEIDRGVGYKDGDVWYVFAIDGSTRNPEPCTPEVCPLRARPR